MQGLVLCNDGIEEFASLEIKDTLNSNTIENKGYVTFNIKEKSDLCKISYLGQSIKKAALILTSFDFTDEENILEKIKSTDLTNWLDEKRTFKVKTLIKNSEIDSDELAGSIGKQIIDNINDYDQKVDLNNPDIIIFVLIDKNKCFVCIDYSGFDLSKREYRIFSHSKNVKSTIAYAMIRFSGFIKGETLIDPFALSGTIPIEAALLENKFPVTFYNKNDFQFNHFTDFDFKIIDDKLTKDKGNIYCIDGMFKNINSSKKNAKVAGINKAIRFSRNEIEWLDTKMDRESVDRIVTCPPNITKYSNKKEIIDIYDEFFHQTEFVLKQTGTIVICTKNSEEIIKASEKQNFKLEKEIEVWQGQEKLILLKLKK